MSSSCESFSLLPLDAYREILENSPLPLNALSKGTESSSSKICVALFLGDMLRKIVYVIKKITSQALRRQAYTVYKPVKGVPTYMQVSLISQQT